MKLIMILSLFFGSVAWAGKGVRHNTAVQVYQKVCMKKYDYKSLSAANSICSCAISEMKKRLPKIKFEDLLGLKNLTIEEARFEKNLSDEDAALGNFEIDIFIFCENKYGKKRDWSGRSD